MGLFKPGAEAIRRRFVKSLIEMPRSMPEHEAVGRSEDAVYYAALDSAHSRRQVTGASIGVAGAVLSMAWLSVTAASQDAMAMIANKLQAISPGLVSLNQVQETFSRFHPVLNAANSLLHQGNTSAALLAASAAMMAAGIGLMVTSEPGDRLRDSLRRDVRKVVNQATARTPDQAPGFDPAPGV